MDSTDVGKSIRPVPLMSVVIATIGRPSLIPILDAISENKKHFPIETIVVVDGLLSDDQLRQEILNRVDQFEETITHIGAAGAYEKAISMAKGEYFRIFSDDDAWLVESHEQLLPLLAPDAILLGRVILSDDLSRTPRGYIDSANSNPIFDLYRPINPFRRNPVYLSLTAAVFPTSVRNTPWISTLAIREDIWWLQQICESGYMITTTDLILSHVKVSHDRTARRQTDEQEDLWLSLLKSRSTSLAKDYAYFHSMRSYAVVGDTRKVFHQLARACRKTGYPNPRQFYAGLGYVLIASFRFLSTRKGKKDV